MPNVAAVLKPIGEGRVALQSVEVEARLEGLLCEAEVRQIYRNLEDVNIEAVYTFPLPLGAVLLDVMAHINGIALRGTVLLKGDAGENYEDAIDKGDSAILLEQPAPGVFTMNVGNLKPGETAEIRFRYAELLSWQGETLRFQLPTTLAPRYGNPIAAGLNEHQAPEHTLSANHGFSLNVVIGGTLAQADFECPSHPVGVRDTEFGRELHLAGGSALMDRDFVLILRQPGDRPLSGLWAHDENGYVGLASFHLPAGAAATSTASCIKLVVDCSGSMAGDSIAEAKEALRRILVQLQPQDHFNLIVFGTDHRLLHPQAVPASPEHLSTALAFVEAIDADMGGTQIRDALDAAYRCGGPADLPANVLLITDGEVWDDGSIVEHARHSGHRIFTVGVGSAVSEAFVRELADASGGACELVSPREDMAAHIVRHFRRINQPRAQTVAVHWMSDPLVQAPPVVESVYAGDTVHVFAWMAQPPVGQATLVADYPNGEQTTAQVTFPPAVPAPTPVTDTLPRLAARWRIRHLEAPDAGILALKYKLVTAFTSYVLIHERQDEDLASGVPALRKVPHLLAAGWGGTGRLVVRAPDSASYAPAMLHESVAEWLPQYSPDQSWRADFVDGLNARYPESGPAVLDINAIADLEALGLPGDIGASLRAIIDAGHEEPLVVAAFLAAFAGQERQHQLSRHVERLIRHTTRSKSIPRELMVLAETALVRGM